jgi:hypothetical protein
VISAAAFRELRPRLALAPRAKRLDLPHERKAAQSAAPSSREGFAEDSRARATEATKDEFAATGIGRELEHRVIEVAFEPEADPAAILTVRYEYRDALVNLGVLPRRPADEDDVLARRERSRGFREPGFAPDPYR